jgi:hypothetical protein
MVELTKDKYTDLCAIINKISYITTDMDMRHSEMSQRSGDNTYNINIDFTPIHSDLNLGIINIPTKYPLLKSLMDTTSEKYIIDTLKDKNSYIITDTISDIELAIPDFTNFTTKYDESLKIDLNQNDKIFTVNLDKTLIKKLNNFVRILGAETVNIDITNGEGKINISSKSKVSTVKLISGFETNVDNFKTDINMECFKMSVGDECVITAYKRSKTACYVDIQTELSGCKVSYKQNRQGIFK